ncbi:unnamed protein product [Clavelina lepadiformis]|uniref:B(0,+)-type amino acid transporter 1 n=1 Tax=Clavelina lepadiformis TaxID=159417 RepID=A0ABP0GH21_CLALP
MIGIPLVTVCYLLVNIAYFTVLSPAEMLESSAVAMVFGDRVFGAASFLVPVAVACSTFGAANVTAFAASRITYAAARNGHMINIFSYVNVKRLTPSPAAILNGTIALIMIIPDAANFSTLIDYFTFTSWLFYGATFLSVIILRIRRPKWQRPYKVFIGIPAICFIASLYLVVAPFLENPSLAYLYAAIFILAGLVFYFPLVYFKKVPLFMDPLTSFLQQALEVVPPPEQPNIYDNSESSHGFSLEDESDFH